VSAVTVVVAHREAMLAEGIIAALARCPGVVPVGSATRPGDLLRFGRRVDAVAIDVEMPGAASVAERLRDRGVRVVFFGDGGPPEMGLHVSTGTGVASLAQALNPRAGVERLAIACLTDREREVLTLVAKGFAAKQVARQLGISHKTVEGHKTRIFSKLGVPNAAAAVGLLMSFNGEGDAA
jgi:DNA-binding NarL/FixJ family response regulator